MHIAALENVPDADAIRLEAERLDLERHLLEMHTYGVTIIPPEVVGAGALIDRLRDAILRVLADRHDLEVPADWRTHSEPWGGPKTGPTMVPQCLCLAVTGSAACRAAMSQNGGSKMPPFNRFH
jgi:hypothetical protein